MKCNNAYGFVPNSYFEVGVSYVYGLVLFLVLLLCQVCKVLALAYCISISASASRIGTPLS